METIAPNRYTDQLSTHTAMVQAQRDFFQTGITRSYNFRKGQLNVLKKAIQRFEAPLIEALRQDLHKSAFESFATEIAFIYQEIDFAQKHLKRWMQPRRVPTPLVLFPAASQVWQQPKGTVLIISPWNFPVNLLLSPLVAAIAAGNTIILKPSELATATEKLLVEMVDATYEPEYIATITGPGEQVITPLIESCRFDHILFTGSAGAGKKIMAAAAKQLSPVTLELGGKCPCIVTENAALDYTARKIAWGKWINAGQTCVAPDYLLVHESIKEKLVEKLVAETRKMFGDKAGESPDYPRVINPQRWKKLVTYLDGQQVLYGGNADEAELYIEPTLVAVESPSNNLMQEEIFGPLLPIISYRSEEEIAGWIDKNPNPLAVYVFTKNEKAGKKLLEQISFGGGCINNTLVQVGNPNLPFGGIGNSGMGSYHGKYGFDTFSHSKAIMSSGTRFDIPLLYAPFKDHIKWLRRLFK